MIRSVRKRLQHALETRALVRVNRRLEPGFALGYVLEIGPTFFLLLLIGDDLRYNGFQAFRMANVSELSVPHPSAKFVEKTLRLRGERRPKNPRVSLASLQELLLSASRAFPLVTIHREIVDPDVCHIGKVVRVTKQKVVLKEITPDAEWDDELGEYRCSEITRVDFGGGYEEALCLVAQAS